MKVVKYLSRIGIALSVLFNVILGGYSNQTFSARNWSWKRKGKWNLVWLIDGVCEYILQPILDFILTFILRSDTKVSLSCHCMTSWIYWRSRKDVQYNHSTGEMKD
jgi:hypothetical protein